MKLESSESAAVDGSDACEAAASAGASAGAGRKRPLDSAASPDNMKRAALDAPADAIASACPAHPSKMCVYLCMECEKAVCEICCLSSISGSCRAHRGHLIHDLPDVIAKRRQQELNK
jgi:hypothetical protein